MYLARFEEELCLKSDLKGVHILTPLALGGWVPRNYCRCLELKARAD